MLENIHNHAVVDILAVNRTLAGGNLSAGVPLPFSFDEANRKIEGLLMPRPTTKVDLIEAANKNFETLEALLGSLSDEEKRSDIFPNERDKNVRDVLVHLSEWHRLLIDWINANMNGAAASFLPERFNWRTCPRMNIEF